MNSFFKSMGIVSLILTLIIAGTVVTGNQAIAKDKKGAFIGIYPTDLDEDEREALDYQGKGGILVEDIVEDAPAQAAGMEAGDIIIEIAGKKVDSVKKLRKILAKYSPEDKVDVLVFRDGKESKYEVVLGAPKQQIVNYEFSEEGRGGFLGVVGVTVDGQLADYFKVKSGVLIKEVVKDTPAEEAGLRAGDIILKINDDAIEDQVGLTTVLWSHKPKEEVVVNFQRDGKKKKQKVVLGEATYGDRFQHVIRDIDLRGLGTTIGDMIKDLEIEVDDPEFQQELKQEMEDLRKELDEMKKELEQQKKEMEKKK